MDDGASPQQDSTDRPVPQAQASEGLPAPVAQEWERFLRERAAPPEIVPPVIGQSEAEQNAADSQQKRVLRPWIAVYICIILILELVAVFFLLLWQGRGGGFRLADWLLGSISLGVFLQTAWCLQCVAVHLYGEGTEKLKTTPKTPIPGVPSVKKGT